MDREKKRHHPKRSFRRRPPNNNIRKIISDIEGKLQDSIKPEKVNGLNSFERKLVHRHFDHNKDFETRTYRNGDSFTLYVYPVGNLERYAKEKAQECLDTGTDVELPPMGSYERYIVHNALKEIPGVESTSQGEGRERQVQIVSKKFGRGLKKIAKKIKLF
ncbi:hypothetical protein GWO43_14420 [candidate division KSB1 bacterium]|nr:hypothetical protein [candidate division KSB1 bacterium]NIR68475.1 hypothetical protein [candidate division KSB1 bacterium]NIS25126.1 hypothetical protein [candidate division KSB1 bacterium]NIT72038.1 hypothetical protein [candidate division KSB1 bacterium]NIU25825.1 hypothetical protein [candidate division KSB1 bacterium]